MTLVAGVDSSTQSCKVVVCDAVTGELRHEAHAPHPEGTEVAPQAWWDALCAAGAGLLEQVAAVAIAGQQHGLVALDAAGHPVRDALLWNDVRSAAAAAELVTELGGPQAWAEAVGSVPVAAFTVAKLRWLADHEPDRADRVARIMLPHDYLTWRLRGGAAEPTTDRGDASGTGYWSAATGGYRKNLLALGFRGRTPELPRVLGPAEAAGRTPSGVLVAAGTGDNAAAALGLGIGDGDVVVSLGTSGTVFARAERPSADATGAIAGFADATGAFLPLVCTLNAARVLSATADLLGVDLPTLETLAAQAPPGADGLVLLPYLAGERTPNRPDATGSLHGLCAATMRPGHIARAAFEGMLCNMAEALDAIRAAGVAPRRVLLIGGAARSALVATIAAQIFATPITVPEPAEYVALGAARQAAWALAGTPQPPDWPARPAGAVQSSADDAATGAAIRARYRQAQTALYGG
ncbi:xylulokinase [Nocardia brasiliensis NBRC 14402]|uniref:xylulokinase n=1 Tax=Nocardia brasiliensis TaxID=37326 RepID=UPI0002F12C8A|nr:xylulokinase [Nocardia brasiliensis]ASF07981.1 xylulokinase [Nocardia brasiliensis]GAJ84628.1 xylulokinase [Nocardia brasiliensis NBRC 14402]SUB54393.1 Xylulose kinase [Nocardia brasiliensis]